MENKKRILSGVQPTGDLHIGNWLGAINNWVTLQEQYETFLCVVDLHAITASYNPRELSQNTISTAALYVCLLYTSPSPRDGHQSRMPSSA